MPGRAFSYLLVNENNIRVLVRELVNYLLVADTEFKQDLTAKICIVVQKFAPSKQWHVDTIIKVCDACARARCSPSMTVRAGRAAATVTSMRSATCVYCRRPKHTARHGTAWHSGLDRCGRLRDGGRDSTPHRDRLAGALYGALGRGTHAPHA